MCPASDYQLPGWVRRASVPPAAGPEGEREGASGTSAPSRTGLERKAPGARSGDMPPDDSLAC